MPWRAVAALNAVWLHTQQQADAVSHALHTLHALHAAASRVADARVWPASKTRRRIGAREAANRRASVASSKSKAAHWSAGARVAVTCGYIR